MMPIVFMFSGQGSHYYQMGKDLFEQNKLFKEKILQADRICQDLLKCSVVESLYAKQISKSEPFVNTLLTHPAIFMVEYAVGQVLLAENILPAYVLGSSLGEFAAAVFAGIMSFETALLSVITQAQMLESYCKPGNMLAILAPTSLYTTDLIIQKNSELAAINFDSHFVISGLPDKLELISQHLKTQQITYQPLAVSHAFHSPLINTAASHYLNFMHQQTIQPATLPFISSAYPQQALTTISHSHFWNSIYLPIQFQATIQYLEGKNNYYYLDVGPAGTLSTFVKYNLKKESNSKSFPILNPFGNSLENLRNLKDIY